MTTFKTKTLNLGEPTSSYGRCHWTQRNFLLWCFLL